MWKILQRFYMYYKILLNFCTFILFIIMNNVINKKKKFTIILNSLNGKVHQAIHLFYFHWDIYKYINVNYIYKNSEISFI